MSIESNIDDPKSQNMAVLMFADNPASNFATGSQYLLAYAN